jgi:hypothetical protein
MTSICYEILPITLESHHVVMLLRPEDKEASSWLISPQPGISPNDAVIESLVHFFGSDFEPAASIVHSTSWRYCKQTGHVILTFLVVLPQRNWMRCWNTSGRIITYRLRKVEQARGDNLRPPDRIKLDNILAHALDHLALLHSYDESIKAVLESAWLKVLQKRQPKPAGYLTLT